MVQKAIIPNLPFFFCAWRSWSHWKGDKFDFATYNRLIIPFDNVAFSSATYLEKVLDRRKINAEQSHLLDSVYQSMEKSEKVPEKEEKEEGSEATANADYRPAFINSYTASTIVTRMKLPDRAMADIMKAIEQAKAR